MSMAALGLGGGGLRVHARGSSCAAPGGDWDLGWTGSMLRDPQGDRATATKLPTALSGALTQQLDALAERLGNALAGAQQQGDLDRRAADRRFRQLEGEITGLAGRLDHGDALRDSDWNERLSELQGTVNGLVEEMQAFSRRLDGLDDRLRARSSGVEELARNCSREAQQHIQALERQARLASAATEEGQRRQATRQRRADQLLEDFAWRLAKMEDELRVRQPGFDVESIAQRPDGDTGEGQGQLNLHAGVSAEVAAHRSRLASIEVLVARLASAQESHHHRSSGAARSAASQQRQASSSAGHQGASCETSNRDAVEDRISALEDKVFKQHADLSSGMASMRVKVDSQLQRAEAVTERLDAQQLRTTELLRTQLKEECAKELNGLERSIAEIGQRVDLAVEAMDTTSVVDRIDSLAQRVSNAEAWQSVKRHEERRRREGGGSSGARTPQTAKKGHLPPRPAELSAPLPPAHTDGLESLPLHEQLGVVADQLEALDDVSGHVANLAVRVAELEQRAGITPGGSGSATRTRLHSGTTPVRQEGAKDIEASTVVTSTGRTGAVEPSVEGSAPSVLPAHRACGVSGSLPAALEGRAQQRGIDTGPLADDRPTSPASSAGVDEGSGSAAIVTRHIPSGGSAASSPSEQQDGFPESLADPKCSLSGSMSRKSSIHSHGSCDISVSGDEEVDDKQILQAHCEEVEPVQSPSRLSGSPTVRRQAEAKEVQRPAWAVGGGIGSPSESGGSLRSVPSSPHSIAPSGSDDD